MSACWKMQMEQMKLSVETRNALFLPTNACENIKPDVPNRVKTRSKTKNEPILGYIEVDKFIHWW